MKTLKGEREEKQKLINLAIKEYLATPEKLRSLTKLGEKYGIQRQTISRHLKSRGIEVVNQQNRCRINENVFDVIDTEEKAYWLGFIFADGNISSTGNKLEMNLSIKDLDHMTKLKNFLSYEEDIRISTSHEKFQICRMSVRNKHLWNTLNTYGCVPNKSLILKFPNLDIFQEKSLVYDFIRGYVDGDGSLGVYNNKESLSILGTKEFLTSLRLILKIEGYLRNKSTVNHENKAFELKYSSSQARLIARKLYENKSVYLERKYNIYKLFCRLEEESSKKKSSKIGEA